MSNMEAVFERPFLLFLALPALAAALLPFFLLNRGKKKRLGSILQAVFEGVASLILVLLISGISFVGKTGGQSVMLVLDLSDSMRPVQELLLEHARELFSLVDEQTKVGAVVFASDCVYTVDLEAGEKKIQNVQVAGDATDISQAIDYAAGLLPDNRDKRLILLSDGKETDSDALATAYLRGAKGLRIDALYFDSLRQLHQGNAGKRGACGRNGAFRRGARSDRCGGQLGFRQSASENKRQRKALGQF